MDRIAAVIRIVAVALLALGLAAVALPAAAQGLHPAGASNAGRSVETGRAAPMGGAMARFRRAATGSGMICAGECRGSEAAPCCCDLGRCVGKFGLPLAPDVQPPVAVAPHRAFAGATAAISGRAFGPAAPPPRSAA